ncbi:MAG: c-type cytochrome [Bacteroidia bacterium]|nr:c-type cytochrome [Bacteroidia bacterium]
MKKLLILLAVTTFIYACGGQGKKETENQDFNAKDLMEDADAPTEAKASDESKGIGKYTTVEVSPTLDKPMADAGSKVYEMKCASCHKLTAEKLVGPGWKNVTSRRKPEWIMNFSTNPDEMLNKDPAAISMLEECLIRMPNQSLTDVDARSVLEFMRQNDGVK